MLIFIQVFKAFSNFRVSQIYKIQTFMQVFLAYLCKGLIGFPPVHPPARPAGWLARRPPENPSNIKY